MILLPQFLFSTYKQYNVAPQLIENILETEILLKNCQIEGFKTE